MILFECLKPIVFIVLFSLVALQASGQHNAVPLPDIVPPSPTVANLMKFEEVPVDHYTGQPEIELPIYSKQLHKNLGLNFRLRYSTQGVKVDNRSGWVGTGWSLDGPAVISRTVRGYPDEINLEGKIGVFHNNDYWNYRNLTAADKDEFNWYAIGSSYKQYDTELDLYQFNLPNGSGRFVVVKLIKVQFCIILFIT
ncbi:MAG: hypothetical protein AAF693_09345 [Bacteroidota bacterium]